MAKISVTTASAATASPTGKVMFVAEAFTSAGVDVIQSNAAKPITVYAKVAENMNWVKVAALKAKDVITQLELAEGMLVLLESAAAFSYQILGSEADEEEDDYGYGSASGTGVS